VKSTLDEQGRIYMDSLIIYTCIQNDNIIMSPSQNGSLK